MIVRNYSKKYSFILIQQHYNNSDDIPIKKILWQQLFSKLSLIYYIFYPFK